MTDKDKNNSVRKESFGKRKPKELKVRFEPSTLEVTVKSGTVLLEAAHKAGIYVTSICGGDGYCGKCKLRIDQGEFKVRPTTLLTKEEIRENIVLACQTQVISDMLVTVPKSHSLEPQRILTDADAHLFSTLSATESGIFTLDPLVKKLYIEMSPPSIQDSTADHERLYLGIRQQIDAPIMQTGFRIMQKLSHLLQRSNYRVTVTVGRRGGTTEVIDIQEGDHSKKNFAVAIDLGTTTVVAHLIDLTNASTIDSEAIYNSQINFGEDYIRRIIYAEENDAFDEMQDRLVNDVNSLIMALATRQNIDLQDISAVICAGNTAMIHFLLNLDATRIRKDPYIASIGFVPPIRAAEIGIQINKRGLLYCLPSVSAYVGSDIVAGVLGTGINVKKKVSLFVDIGTNGEVVLGNKDWLVCASSSAGPAFEGSGVTHGMRAARGAIEKLSITSNGQIQYKTIGDCKAVGICGSGLLDIIAEFYNKQIIDRTGRFVDKSGPQTKNALWQPKLNYTNHEKWFQITPKDNGHEEISITQADIDNLMRSKAGVYAAIRVLMEATETKCKDIDAIYLAGGFGNFLNPDQAITIGMLPDIPREKIQFMGNTSIAGAKTVLLSNRALEAAESIAKNMTYFDLMSNSKYMDEFIKAKFLPHTNLSLFPSAKILT